MKGKTWGEAALREALGQLAEADAAWDRSLQQDPIAATIAIRQLVEGPRSAVLLGRATAALAKLYTPADGAEPPTLPGPDGAAHPLERLTPDEARARLLKDGALKFVIVPELDSATSPSPESCSSRAR